MNLCEISFLSKKSCRKSFFQKLKLLPYRGIRTCKSFWKIGLKMFLSFVGFYPIWGSELVKIYEKWGWNFFLRFFGFNQCEIVWNKFLSKKSFRKKFFQILKFLPYKGIRTCKNFWNMGLKNVFAFFRLSPYMGIRTWKHAWKSWLKNVFFCVFSAFTLYGDQNL